MFNSSPMLSKLNNDPIPTSKKLNINPQSIAISSSSTTTTTTPTPFNSNNLNFLNLNDPSYELNTLKHFDFQSDEICSK